MSTIGADLYTSLAGKSKNTAKEMEPVHALVGDLITNTSSTAAVLQEMRPVYLHGANMIIDKKKTPKRQPRNRPLNARERRSLKVYDLDSSAIQYTSFLPLHDLWNGYMNDLKDGGELPEQFAQKLLKADFHGSILTVTKCKNPVYIGCTGIVIQETMNVFSIVTTANKVKKIPKAGSIFLLTTTACKETFTLYGSQLQFRAAERAAKKFKIKPTIDL